MEQTVSEIEAELKDIPPTTSQLSEPSRSLSEEITNLKQLCQPSQQPHWQSELLQVEKVVLSQLQSSEFSRNLFKKAVSKINLFEK